MPITGPVDPDHLIAVVKDTGTTWEAGHLLVGGVATWLAIENNTWTTTTSQRGIQISEGSFRLLRAAMQNADNSFRVSTAAGDVGFELRSEAHGSDTWAVGATV